MKFIKDFLNSGTAKQQKNKRLGALLICITAAILVLALLVLAVFGIVGAITKNRSEEEVAEDTTNQLPKGYVTTTFPKEWSVNGTMLEITASQARAYSGTAPTVQPKQEVREAAGALGLYRADHGDIKLQQETMDAFHAMVKAFDAAKQGSSDYTANLLYLDSNLAPKSATLSADTKEIIKSGTIVILSSQPTTTDIGNETSIYDAENKTGVGVYKWFYDNAAKYGFIPVNQTAEEGNVFRYVGVAHASYMAKNKLNFSEYYQKLVNNTQPGKTLSVTVTGEDGKAIKYEMYYIAPTEQQLVPEKYAYTVSGDNAGGYIVTVNKSVQTDKQA